MDFGLDGFFVFLAALFVVIAIVFFGSAWQMGFSILSTASVILGIFVLILGVVLGLAGR